MNSSTISREFISLTACDNSLMVTMAFPYALDSIGWKTYMINGAWDVLQVVFLAIYWVETKGKTLEEIDEIFDGPSAANAIHVKDVIEGRDPGLALKGGAIVVTKDGAKNSAAAEEA